MGSMEMGFSRWTWVLGTSPFEWNCAIGKSICEWICMWVLNLYMHHIFRSSWMYWAFMYTFNWHGCFHVRCPTISAVSCYIQLIEHVQLNNAPSFAVEFVECGVHGYLRTLLSLHMQSNVEWWNDCIWGGFATSPTFFLISKKHYKSQIKKLYQANKNLTE